MAKRFTDNEKWKKHFFKTLSTVHKLFFLYILDNCDNAGVWHIEVDVAELRIGESIDLQLAKKDLGKHIHEFDNKEKWFIPFFVEFQYGLLNPKVNAHKSVIDKLGKRKLTKIYEQFINCSRSNKDKDKDKSKVKVENNGESFNVFWELYDKKVNRNKSKIKWDNLNPEIQNKILIYIPKYKDSQPDKQYRKNPEVFLNNDSWEDEIIDNNKNSQNSLPRIADYQHMTEMCLKDRSIFSKYDFHKDENDVSVYTLKGK